MLLLGEQDFAASGHDNLGANSLVMVTLRQATSRRPPYHRALILLLLFTLFAARTSQAQTVERNEGILIDTSGSISRGGTTNELFHDYLLAPGSYSLPSRRIVACGCRAFPRTPSEERMKSSRAGRLRFTESFPLVG